MVVDSSTGKPVTDKARLQEAAGDAAGKGSDATATAFKKLPSYSTPSTESKDKIRFPRIDSGGNESAARDILHNTDDYNEEQRRRAMLQGAEANIKAIDDVYDTKVEREVQVGKKDLARSNTISAVTGMMAAPEAATRAGNADRRTEERVETVNEMRRLAIQSIYDKVDQNIIREKEAHLQTQRENAANVLDEVAQNANVALNSFAAQGVSWDALEQSDSETLQTLVKQTGQDPFTLRKLYEQSLPAEMRPETIFEGWQGSNFVTIRRNADGTVSNETHTAEELGMPKGVNLETITLGNQVYWYDKDKPLGENGQPELIPVGARSGYSGGTTGDGVADETGSILPFDEWKKTPEAMNLLRSSTGGLNVTADTEKNVLRPAYEEATLHYYLNNPDSSKNYTSSTIPSPVKSLVISDIESGATKNDLYNAYPDVSTSYLSSLYNSLQKKESSSNSEVDDGFVDAFLDEGN